MSYFHTPKNQVIYKQPYCRHQMLIFSSILYFYLRLNIKLDVLHVKAFIIL